MSRSLAPSRSLIALAMSSAVRNSAHPLVPPSVTSQKATSQLVTRLTSSFRSCQLVRPDKPSMITRFCFVGRARSDGPPVQKMFSSGHTTSHVLCSLTRRVLVLGKLHNQPSSVEAAAVQVANTLIGIFGRGGTSISALATITALHFLYLYSTQTSQKRSQNACGSPGRVHNVPPRTRGLAACIATSQNTNNATTSVKGAKKNRSCTPKTAVRRLVIPSSSRPRDDRARSAQTAIQRRHEPFEKKAQTTPPARPAVLLLRAESHAHDTEKRCAQSQVSRQPRRTATPQGTTAKLLLHLVSAASLPMYTLRRPDMDTLHGTPNFSKCDERAGPCPNGGAKALSRACGPDSSEARGDGLLTGTGLRCCRFVGRSDARLDGDVQRRNARCVSQGCSRTPQPGEPRRARRMEGAMDYCPYSAGCDGSCVISSKGDDQWSVMLF